MDDRLLLAASNRTETGGGTNGYEGKFHRWVLSDEEIHQIKTGKMITFTDWRAFYEDDPTEEKK